MAEKVVVTGGLGFIGSHLVSALREKGYDVTIVDIKEGRDVRNTDDMRKTFSGATYVFHLAALPRVQYSIEHPDETNDHNLNGTLSVFLAAKDAQVKKVVYAASSSAYGDQEIMPLVETMVAAPKSPYGLQKYVGELYAKVFNEVYNLPTVSLRYFNVYGPGASDEGAYALVISKFLRQRKKNEPLTITGDGEQTRDFTHVRDIVDATIRAAESNKTGNGEVFNIGGGREVAVNEIAGLIGGEKVHVPPRLEPRRTKADTTRARSVLQWEPRVTLEEGIRELKELYGIS